MIACAQKATSRDVSDRLTPTFDLNHWRCEAINAINASGGLQLCVPLAVALSLGERERSLPRCAESRRSGLAKARRTILPLLWGEGRGEGAVPVLLASA